MRDGIPSFTALAVAFARGVDDVDPVAQSLMPFPLGALLRAGHEAKKRGPLRYLLRASPSTHLPLRTLAIDAVIARATSEGVRQLVVLGAGLDARAWRMPALAETVVFEIDHPATQAYKSSRIGARKATCREVRFVNVDFAKDDLETRLRDSEFNPSAPAIFVWEGVTMYLPPAATEGTLAAIARLSGAHGVLAMTYATPNLAGLVAPVRPIVRAAFGLIGEPLLGLMSTEEARAHVERAGLAFESDTGAREWAREAGRPAPWVPIAERLLVART